jgi:hypothetical protein
MDPRIAAIKVRPGSNERRYWPPGQHPAIQRQKLELQKAQKLAEVHGMTEGLAEYIDYIQEQIAAFEERESELKRRMYEFIIRGRKGRR